LREIVGEFHHVLFGVPIETHISRLAELSAWRIVLVPSLGGLAYGLFSIAARVKPVLIISCRYPLALRLMMSHGALASLRGRRRAAS
jgi:hypothetical protein